MTGPTALVDSVDLIFEVTNPASPAYTIDLSDGFNGYCEFVGSLMFEGAEYDNTFSFFTYLVEDQQLIV